MKTISDLICKRRIQSIIKPNSRSKVNILQVLELEPITEDINRRYFVVKTDDKLKTNQENICLRVYVRKTRRGDIITDHYFISLYQFNLYVEGPKEYVKEFKL